MALLGAYVLVGIPIFLFAAIAWTYEAVQRRKTAQGLDTYLSNSQWSVAEGIGDFFVGIGHLLGGVIAIGGFGGMLLLGLYLLVRFIKWAWVGFA